MTKFDSIDQVLTCLKTDLDTSDDVSSDKIKASIIFACNASGKTRLSKLFADEFEDQVLCYNAFVEDLFTWNNDDCVLNIDIDDWIFQTINDQGLYNSIGDNFQQFTGSKLEPIFDFALSQVRFRIHTDAEGTLDNIKISRGEESAFIWSVFYTVLDVVIDTLNEEKDDRSTDDFDCIKYVVIDDPVSSMDDTRIISIALQLATLIYESKHQLRFLVTTHHALFFNIVFNASRRRGGYILSNSKNEIHLTKQSSDSPFAYHHLVISEIEDAIKNKSVKKYHFNLFRALLEKTANFLGYSNGWKELLANEYRKNSLEKTLDHYSHNSLAEIEASNLSENDMNDFEGAFRAFIDDFKWSVEISG